MVIDPHFNKLLDISSFVTCVITPSHLVQLVSCNIFINPENTKPHRDIFNGFVYAVSVEGVECQSGEETFSVIFTHELLIFPLGQGSEIQVPCSFCFIRKVHQQFSSVTKQKFKHSLSQLTCTPVSVQFGFDMD